MLALLVALVLHPPVDGTVARAFRYGPDPFARGGHRGVDFHSRSGERVRAACSGRVTHAGPTPAGSAVTVRCGGYAVTHLPLAAVAVRSGRLASAGATIGRSAPGHEGLHLGVRRAGDPFGYVDPAPLLAAARRPPVAAPPAGRHRTRPASPAVGDRGGRAPATVEPVPRAASAGAARLRPGVSWPAVAGLVVIALALPARRLRARGATRTGWSPRWARL